MLRLNNFILNHSKLILFVFLGLTLLMILSQKRFERHHAGEISIQFQSEAPLWVAPAKVDIESFNSIVAGFEDNANPIIGFWYFFFFGIDFIWALSLLAVIYILCKSFGEVSGVMKRLIIISSLAYTADVLENFTYIFQFPLGIEYLEYINWVKLLFYFICLGFLIFYTVKRLALGRTKPEVVN